MSIALSEIKGLSEILAQAKRTETVNREDAWLASTYVVAGQRVRTMTVSDFTALLQFNSPLLSRRLPSPTELVFFLWIMSADNLKLRESKFPAWYCQWRAKRFSRRLTQRLEIESVERAQSKAELTEDGYTLPEDSPLAKAIADAFKYIDILFMDKPAGLSKNGLDSGLCYLTAWFDAMQSEYHLPTKEVWAMPLPVLFARLKAIQHRVSNAVPAFNEERDKVMQRITSGLNSKLYTEDDLRVGRVDLINNRLRAN